MRYLGLLVLVAACQVDARSDAFRCDQATPCTDGRTCVDGWCVLGGDGGSTIDASTDAPVPDALDCPSQCTGCAGNTCTIACNNMGDCAAPIVCPAGWDCVVSCGGKDSCAGGITCAPDACDVECTGRNACRGGVSCVDSCACDVNCSGVGSCSPAAMCPGTAECDTGNGCTSTPATCQSC